MSEVEFLHTFYGWSFLSVGFTLAMTGIIGVAAMVSYSTVKPGIVMSDDMRHAYVEYDTPEYIILVSQGYVMTGVEHTGVSWPPKVYAKMHLPIKAETSLT